MSNSAPFAKFCLYADDNTIITSPNSIVQFLHNCFHLCKCILLWFASNKLALNYNKMQLMCFGSKSVGFKSMNTIDKHALTIVEQVKFLGVYLIFH